MARFAKSGRKYQFTASIEEYPELPVPIEGDDGDNILHGTSDTDIMVG